MSANSQLVSVDTGSAALTAEDLGKTAAAVSGTVLLTLLAAVISLAPAVAAACQMHRDMVLGGAWWQLLTCHLTHWNIDHLFWDAVVFAGLGAICEHRQRLSWAICVCGSAIAIPIALLVLCPAMTTYRGLSGIDSAIFALFVVGNLADARKRKDRNGVLIYATVILGFAAKLAFEVGTDSTFFVDSRAAGFVPIVEAHVVGAMVGTLVACCTFIRVDDQTS